MKTMIALLLAVAAFGQTRLAKLQYPAPVGLNEEASWCPGPILTTVDAKTLLIGKNWSAATPCYLHMDLVQTVDPLNVTKLTAPVTVHLSPAFTVDDALNIWINGPSQTSTEPASIQFSLKQDFAAPSITCDSSTSTSCNLAVDTQTPRVFPPNSLAVGFVPINAGSFHPKPQSILGSHQVYIAGATPMQIVPFQNGYLFQVNGQAQAAAQVAQLIQQQQQWGRAHLDAYTNELQQKLWRDQPVSATEVKRLQEVALAASGEVSRLRSEKPPTPDEITAMKRNLDMMAQTYQRQMQEVVMNARGPYGYGYPPPMAPRLQPPSAIEANGQCPVQGGWAIEGDYKWECLDSKWRRYTLEQPYKDYAFVGPTLEQAAGTRVAGVYRGPQGGN